MDTPEQARSQKGLATWLRLAAFVGAALIDVIQWPKLVADQNSTSFNVLFVAVPILLTLIPLLLGLTSRHTATTAATWISAGLMTIGAILFGLTIGAYFLIVAIILVIAAIVQTGATRQTRHATNSV